MIQRFCFVKLRDAEVAGRTELAERLRSELAAAGADAVVGIPADDSASRWDLSIVITTPSLDAWHALSRVPELIDVLHRITARAEVVKAWTFSAP